MPTAMPTAELSEYEKQRLENIRRNQQVLAALGLVSSDAELHHDLRKGEPKAKRQKAAAGSDEEARAAVRRSHRLAGLPAEGAPEGSAAADQPSRSWHDVSGEHEAARDEHEASWARRWSGKQSASTVVGTASYEHTLMRVMTMSDGGLANRIKAIERACGQHAVVKMKLFATILALEGYVELAEDAAAAHKRLVDKLGEPGEDEAAVAEEE
tara:strand:+ start:236 stop:871 length:636 start_codon:yes stop_codon:yes gene_type:complete